MPRVKFTTHLQRYFPDLNLIEEAEGATVADVIGDLDARFPGLAAYLLDDLGALRPHVNVFIGRQMIQDRGQLKDSVAADDQLYIFQALSGG